MAKRAIIQIREEIQVFSKKHLAQALDISPSTLNKWIKEGAISYPSGNGGKYSRDEVEVICKQFNARGKSTLNGNINQYYEDIRASKLRVIGEGIFLISPSIKDNSNQHLKQLIQRHGVWSAQGLNNHIHLRDCVKNPILQLKMAKEIINCWVDQIRRKNLAGSIIIYLNGRTDSTVCIYRMRRVDNQFLAKYDKELGIGECAIKKLYL